MGVPKTFGRNCSSRIQNNFEAAEAYFLDAFLRTIEVFSERNKEKNYFIVINEKRGFEVLFLDA